MVDFLFPWLDIAGLIIQGTGLVLFEPMFWLVLALTGWQYWQLRRSQLRMFGVYGYNFLSQALHAGLLGAAGGIAGSFMLTLVGVTLNQLGLNYIWPVAVALMLINLRFLCFAYAGGLVALANVLFGWPEVNVPQVLALVAVLHITESILIALSGGYSAAPAVLRRSDGRHVGAFNLQNFWPLPLVLLAAVIVPAGSSPVGVNMPDWWPLLPPPGETADGQSWQYVMIPVVAALGYTDIAVASHPYRRRLLSARNLAGYSILLLAMALLSVEYEWLRLFAAFLSPAGHELLIRLDSRREMNGAPLFTPPGSGVMVLDTVPGAPARRAGLRPGDIICHAAGMAVNSREDLAAAIAYAPEEFSIVLERKGQTIRRQVAFIGQQRRLGVITVPEGVEESYIQLAGDRYGLMDWLWRKIKS